MDTITDEDLGITHGTIDEPWCGMLYGPSGVGKTNLAIKIPGGVILDLEKGSGRYLGPKIRIPFDTNPSKTINKIKAKIAQIANSGRYKTIIIDSLASIIDLHEKEYLLASGKLKLDASRRGLDYQCLNVNLIEFFGGKSSGMMHYLQERNCNLLILAHENTYDKVLDGTAVVTTQPHAFQGFRIWLAGHNMDFVFYYTNHIRTSDEVLGMSKLQISKTDGKKIYTSQQGGIFAKNRYDLKPVIYDPTPELFTNLSSQQEQQVQEQQVQQVQQESEQE